MNVPHCPGCGHALDRVDHYGIEHTVLDDKTYRDVGINDMDATGDNYGIASEVDVRCAYCGTALDAKARAFYYKHWNRVQEVTALLAGKPGAPGVN